MGGHAQAESAARAVPPTKGNLQTVFARRSGNSSQATEIGNEAPVSPTLSSPTSDPGESRQENRMGRWSQIRLTCRKTGLGRSHSPETDETEETQAAQTSRDTQASTIRAKTARN